jgi:diguanylate cyclase (GGDEF)-like protein/PAS domain S-box-containing protein
MNTFKNRHDPVQAQSGQESSQGDHMNYDNTEGSDGRDKPCTQVDDRLVEPDKELAGCRALLDAVVENVSSVIFVKDIQDGKFVLINRAAEELLGIQRQHLIGKDGLDEFAASQSERFLRLDPDSLAKGQSAYVNDEWLVVSSGLRSFRTHQVAVNDASGNPRYRLGISEDVTEQLTVEKRNDHLSRHDILTDLPNRRFFQTALELQISRNAPKAALLLLDLDGFKAINKSLGHDAGDDLLRKLSVRLNRCKGEQDFLARLGGDEFGIIHQDATKKSSARLAARLIAALNKPFEVGGRLVSIGASAGLALFPKHGHTSDILMRRADLALQTAKATEKGSYLHFDPKMEKKANAELRLREELKCALARSQLQLVYQPIVDAQTHKVVCCEALLRWKHPEMGLVSPAEFVPIAESSGLIHEIGKWVIETACTEARRWPEAVKLAVNLSPRQLSGTYLLPDLSRILERTDFPARRLELEITESIFLSNSDENIRLLKEIKQLGVSIALDDFGTGYSSLAYLRNFSFDKLKIDKSFISGLPGSDSSLAIVRAIIGLGKSFAAVVTAEGVETREEYYKLLTEGCDQFQGFLFGRPMEGTAIRQLIADAKVYHAA